MRILLLHALPLDERIWAPQLDALADHEVVAPNLYALDGSSMDAWATALLRQVPGDFLVVGASMGGYCALALARLAPERVLGLVLSGSRADADSPERKHARMASIEAIQRDGAEGLWRIMQPVVAGEAVSDDLRERIRELALEQPPDGLTRAVRAIRDRPDSTDVVRALRVPFLVVTGDRDPINAVDYARSLAAEAPDGEAVVFEQTGHLPSFERPDTFDTKLLELVGRLD
jgi:pimeloyl-ACP methyl ester carboxylesterase